MAHGIPSLPVGTSSAVRSDHCIQGVPPVHGPSLSVPRLGVAPSMPLVCNLAAAFGFAPQQRHLGCLCRFGETMAAHPNRAFLRALRGKPSQAESEYNSNAEATNPAS